MDSERLSDDSRKKRKIVVNAIEAVFDVREFYLFSRSKLLAFMPAKRCMSMVFVDMGLSLKETSRVIGRHHTTVMHNVRGGALWYEMDPAFAENVEKVRALIGVRECEYNKRFRREVRPYIEELKIGSSAEIEEASRKLGTWLQQVIKKEKDI